jgi:hypothetical protein
MVEVVVYTPYRIVYTIVSELQIAAPLYCRVYTLRYHLHMGSTVYTLSWLTKSRNTVSKTTRCFGVFS